MSSIRCSSFRILSLAAALALGTASNSRADYAQNQAAQAQADYDAAKARADQAQAVVGSASAHAVGLATQVKAAQQQASDIRDRMDRGQAGLMEIQARIQSASNTLDARHREMAAADVQYGPRKIADDQARLEAIKSFEDSAEYHAALQAITDSAATLQNVQDESARLGHQPAADPNVLIAQNRLSAAKAALDTLRGKFMQEQLPQVPKVAVADQNLGAEQAQYDVIAAKASAAEKELADARASLDRQTKGLAGDKAMLEEISADITQMQADQATAQAAADQAANDASDAVTQMNTARKTRDDAVAALQQPAGPPVVYPSTSYEYGPPPVVYGQPGYGYAPGYYGNIVVVPGRGGYGYNGGYRGGYQGPANSHDHGDHGHGNGNGHR